MRAKYRKKTDNPENLQYYKVICIDCGKEKLNSWPKGMLVPDATEYIGTYGWVSCHIFNDHRYYNEDKLEKVK